MLPGGSAYVSDCSVTGSYFGLSHSVSVGEYGSDLFLRSVLLVNEGNSRDKEQLEISELVVRRVSGLMPVCWCRGPGKSADVCIRQRGTSWDVCVGQACW